MDVPSYRPPVDQLLTYADLTQQQKREPWPDYVQELGLTAEHVPELIRLMTNTTLWEMGSDRIEVWSTLHAWRALAQLQAVEAVAPLLNMFEAYEDDDYLNDEIPDFLVLIGPQVLPIVQPYLDRDDFSEWGKIAILGGIIQIGQTFPEQKATCIEMLRHQLEAYRKNDEGLNSYLVEGLAELQAIDAASLIEQVYAEENIDEMLVGTWPSMQVRLGLKQESDFSEEDLIPEVIREMRARVAEGSTLADLLEHPGASALDLGLPINPDAFRPEAPPRFGQGFLRVNNSASPRPVPGFGSSQSTAKKTKKKK